MGELITMPNIPSSSMEGYLAILVVKLFTWVPMTESQTFTLILDLLLAWLWPMDLSLLHEFYKDFGN